MKSLLVVLVAALAVIGLGLTLAMHGEADDAPGLAGIEDRAHHRGIRVRRQDRLPGGSEVAG